MNIKEQESQLAANMIGKIIITVIVWLIVLAYIAYSLWSMMRKKVLVTSGIVSVPSINVSNLNTLRSSIKYASPSAARLSPLRPEPFD